MIRVLSLFKGLFQVPILLLASAFFAMPIFAGEGFFTTLSNFPGGARTAWMSTFAVTYKSSGTPASAFLVRKENGDTVKQYGKYFFYFLTSNHVVAANGCAETQICSPILLSSSLGIDTIGNSPIATNDLKRTFDRVQVVGVSKEPDLALLRVEVDSKTYFANDLVEIKPVPNCAIANGTMIYIIGYPGTSRRSGRVIGTTDADRGLNIKRWSVGFIIDQAVSNLNGSGPLAHWTSTTADALGGNSGGPAITDRGELVGVMDSGLDFSDPSTQYLGNESLRPMTPHSFLESCRFVDAFLKRYFK